MTLIISMCTRIAVYMIADSLITEDYKGMNIRADTMEKIYSFDDNIVLLGFWGTTKNIAKNYDLKNVLDSFQKVINKEDNILTIAEKLKNLFKDLKVLENDDELGFHLCGYIENIQYLHHVFHSLSLNNNDFINEDCKREYHRGYQTDLRDLEFPIIFNGDNKIPNIFINLLRAFGDIIDYKNFERERAKEFLKFMMEIAIKLQKFSNYSGEFGKLIDYPLFLYEIKNNGEIVKERISRPNT